MPNQLLFVDDEQDLEILIRQLFRREVRKNEIELTFAKNGQEALNIFDENPEIEVVFSDINMPEMDGLTMLEKLCEKNKILQTIIMSAYGDMQNIRTAMNRGAFDFLTKPINFEDLNATLNKSLKYVNKLKEGIDAQKKALELDVRNKFMRNVFGRYMTDDVVNNLLDSPEGLDLGGKKQTVTIMMSDLRGFTSLSERYSADEIISYLNSYLEAMINVIMSHQGTIIEIIGDGIFVVFGAPVYYPDHAQKSLACAIDMQLAMQTFNEKNVLNSLPSVEMGIGLNTGEVVVGNIGSLKRAKYGVVGNHVNLAARIESFTVGNQIFISEATCNQVKESAIVKSSSTVQLKGIKRSVTIYEITGLKNNLEKQIPENIQTLTELNESLPITYFILEDKNVSESTCRGEINKLSEKSAEVTTSETILPLSNIKIKIDMPEGSIRDAEIYGKVLSETDSDLNTYRIQFTSIPPEAADFIDNYIKPGQ